MPELPEVNKAKNLLQKHCVGKKIVSVNVVSDVFVVDGNHNTEHGAFSRPLYFTNKSGI